MSTVIGIVVYGTFALGYVLVLALTERSAARYVAAGCRSCHERTTVVLTSGRPSAHGQAQASRTRRPAGTALSERAA